MLLFLLVPALALLVSPAAVGCSHHNLRRIIELVGKYNESLSKEFFVEDVQPLYEAGCGDKFFCKVHEVLLKHENITKRKDEMGLLKNLREFNNRHRNTSCEELLKDVQPTGIEIQIPKVIELLSKCIKQRNWNGNKR
ncbi:hypothetical protein INR49_008977 [Caranx melampygus]|nr:hypothetical protein INR49_008977 [Caranx melampygus]